MAFPVLVCDFYLWPLTSKTYISTFVSSLVKFQKEMVKIRSFRTGQKAGGHSDTRKLLSFDGLDKTSRGLKQNGEVQDGLRNDWHINSIFKSVLWTFISGRCRSWLDILMKKSTFKSFVKNGCQIFSPIFALQNVDIRTR